MNTTLTRIAMALPIAAALLALTAGWASAQPGPGFPDDITTNQPVVDPQPQPPKWQQVPDIDLGDITIDPGADDPAPPADPADDPAPADDDDNDSDHDDDSDHGQSTGGSTVRPAVTKSVPAPVETDTEFRASDARNASESISPKYVQGAGVQQLPTGVVVGLGALLVAVIGWAAYRHHRLSL
jgi:hypothetical protein